MFETVLTTLGNWPTLILGLVILVFSGDALVKGAVNLALRLGIPALVVGLTVVAFGTSAPELIVSVNAALAGQAGIAVGNVVGSNIVNVLLILGLPLLITTIHSSQTDTRRSYVIMLATAVFFAAFAFTGPLTWWHGLILLGGSGGDAVGQLPYLDGASRRAWRRDGRGRRSVDRLAADCRVHPRGWSGWP